MKFLTFAGREVTVGLTLLLACSLTLPSTGQGVTPAKVQAAIDHSIQYLEQRQDKKTGKWPGYESDNPIQDYGCGQTALVVLALLNAGRTPDDPFVKRGLNHLRNVVPKKTYEAALQTMVFCAAEPNRDLADIKRNVDWLISIQKTPESGGLVGAWGYNQFLGGGDPSNSQFALLALWEAQRVGIAIPRDTLEYAYNHWATSQLATGAWNYSFIDATPRGSMTCAGIASLLIAEDALRQAGDAQIINGKIQCCMGDTQILPVDLGVNWLVKNFTVQANPPIGSGANYLYYYLYALERTGRLTGLRYFGDHDWYREGCELLVQRQDPTQGFFPTEGYETDAITTTALGLLFLAKGKRQIVLGRLDYRSDQDTSGDWALHRHAIQNLTGHIEKFWKRDLAWQTVALKASKLENLLECPVLFISGRGKLTLDARDKALLKAYVEQGGFIFAEACQGDGCNGAAFDASFRALMEELFEEPLQKLSPAHPIWFAETRIDPQTLPEQFWLYGIEKCCRTSVVYAPSSLSCRWELMQPYGIPLQLNENLQGDLNNAVKLGVNVVSYATGRELKEKLEPVQIVANSQIRNAAGRGTISIAKVLHSGGANDVPKAVTNLLEVLHRETGLDVASKSILVSPTEEQLRDHPLLYIHGRQPFTFSEPDRLALRTHIQNGGFLFGDAICANKGFADALRAEMKAILPEAEWQQVPNDHPMLTSQFGGFDVRRVTIVDPQNDPMAKVQIQKRQGVPQLEMLILDERVVAVFSPIDISCALESRGASQCRGYLNKDAARIGVNILLYALLQ